MKTIEIVNELKEVRSSNRMQTVFELSKFDYIEFDNGSFFRVIRKGHGRINRKFIKKIKIGLFEAAEMVKKESMKLHNLFNF